MRRQRAVLLRTIKSEDNFFGNCELKAHVTHMLSAPRLQSCCSGVLLNIKHPESIELMGRDRRVPCCGNRLQETIKARPDVFKSKTFEVRDGTIGL